MCQSNGTSHQFIMTWQLTHETIYYLTFLVKHLTIVNHHFYIYFFPTVENNGQKLQNAWIPPPAPLPLHSRNYPSGNKRKQKLKKEERGEVVWEDQTRHIDPDNPDLPHFAPLAHCQASQRARNPSAYIASNPHTQFSTSQSLTNRCIQSWI